jgi:tRNA(Ile)-lysidine synthetase-like protein
MNFSIKPGKYLVAVSGGVDSVALLHLLLKSKDVELVVAHYDHGIRVDSYLDRELVEATAEGYDLPFVTEQGKLGVEASEAVARTARYHFLFSQAKMLGCEAVITAHHQDDLLETALLNLIRGTGRKGLASLRSTNQIVRPLLHVTKTELTAYAKSNKLVWREDSTNQDPKYARNRVRQSLMPPLNERVGARDYLLALIENTDRLNKQIDTSIARLFNEVGEGVGVSRRAFVALPYSVAAELTAFWLRKNELEFDKKTIRRIVLGVQQLTTGKYIEVSKDVKIKIEKNYLLMTGVVNTVSRQV